MIAAFIVTFAVTYALLELVDWVAARRNNGV